MKILIRGLHIDKDLSAIAQATSNIIKTNHSYYWEIYTN